MERFVEIDNTLKKDGYTRRQLFDWMQRYYPHYDENSCAWVLGSLLQRGILYNVGFDVYFRKGNSYQFSLPDNPIAKDIASCLLRLDPNARFVSYVPSDLNGLLGDEAALDMIIFEAERKWLYPLYLELKAKTKASILLNPTDDERNRYYQNGCVILRPLPSKAPFDEGRLTLEKLCVDLLKGGDLGEAFPLLDIDATEKKLLEGFDLNIKTLLSYAERRGKKDEILNLLYEYLPKTKIELLEKSNKFPKRKDGFSL